MDWLDRMNRAMDYMETHLADEISYEEIARKACCSSYHFQRMFPFITGVPLSEYIRRRRLTLAAFDLQTAGCKVIDVALKYGYESPESFTRAFKSLHGISPAAARRVGASLKAYPRMAFQLSIKGDIEMKYRIETREAFDVFGIYGEISTDRDKAFEEVDLPVQVAHRLEVHDLLQQTGGVGHPAEVHGPSGPRLHMGRLPGARLRQDAGAVEPDLDGVVPDFRVRAGSGAAIRDVLRYGRAFHGRNLDPRRPQGA